MVRVEVGVASLTDLVKTHIEADCTTRGCDLHDNVVSLMQTQKTARRLTWSGLLVSTGLILRYIWKGVLNG